MITSIIGHIDGNIVEYNPATDRVTCKDVIVSAKRMVEAYDSPLDRVLVKKDLALEDIGFMGFTLGCFKIGPEEGKELIQSLKNARNGKS